MRRNCLVILVGAAAMFLESPDARAVPSINYPNFLFNSPFQDNGNALGVNFDTLLMTTDGNQNSSTFVNTAQDLTQSFTAQYGFYIGSGYFYLGNHLTDGSGPGGVAFVIQGDPRGPAALGGGNNQIGYGDGQANAGQAIQDSLALVYSTFGGSDQFELFTNTTNANFNAAGAPLATQTGSENLSNLFSQMITVNYQAPDVPYPNGAVTVLLNGGSIGLDNIALPASLTSLAGGNTGYFGFTASTGGTTGTGPQSYISSLVVGAPISVPEPASIFLLPFGAGLLLMRRRTQPH